ncbi:MAG: gliding motility protein [Flavobacteriales bacterium CG18_big_fil_WC_8_21_14_2_50_32_9]|nr:outer membrane lipoprotein carrier protein LolA [Flavobacteriales bacterium]PIQ14459.1 MAG: gliding motility protein [Flavobacteriales bacterium CG18_big_fil_WC_8_21_14_2_50_32_9]PJC62905.1 MAG: gliding motility protein [Flavobacteriales bacterium CG_4_9_14_0_2_um_filter_32_27]
MKNLIFLFISSLIALSSVAQDDVKAKAILDKLSAKTKKYTSIKTTFDYQIVNKAEGLNEKQAGSLQIKGEKYYLSIKGQDVFSDGKSIYTLLKDAEEVQINSIPDENEEDVISPNTIFTLYEKGFKYKYVKEENGNDIINLYPNNPQDKSFHRVEVQINKTKGEIYKVTVFGKDGTDMSYIIKTFTPNIAITDDTFVYSKAKYPKYDVIDLR